MAHPKDNEVYPINAVVRIVKTGQLAIIRDITYLKDGKNFLNYRGEIQGRGNALYAIYHHDIELEIMPLQ